MPAFSPLPTMFSKGFFLRDIKSHHRVVKSYEYNKKKTKNVYLAYLNPVLYHNSVLQHPGTLDHHWWVFLLPMLQTKIKHAIENTKACT